MAGERITRGRLSSLDLAPEEAQDDIRWAMGELNARNRTQADILFELNDRLAVKGVDPISKSAFNRKSVATARAGQRMAESRAIFAGIAEYLTPEKIDDGNIALGEFIKTLIAEIVSQSEGLTPKGAMELSKAFQSVVSGQNLSFIRMQKSDDRAKAEAADAIAKVAADAGLSADRIAQLRREFLGIRPQPAPPAHVVSAAVDVSVPVLEFPAEYEISDEPA